MSAGLKTIHLQKSFSAKPQQQRNNSNNFDKQKLHFHSGDCYSNEQILLKLRRLFSWNIEQSSPFRNWSGVERWRQTLRRWDPGIPRNFRSPRFAQAPKIVDYFTYLTTSTTNSNYSSFKLPTDHNSKSFVLPSSGCNFCLEQKIEIVDNFTEFYYFGNFSLRSWDTNRLEIKILNAVQTPAWETLNKRDKIINETLLNSKLPSGDLLRRSDSEVNHPSSLVIHPKSGCVAAYRSDLFTDQISDCVAACKHVSRKCIYFMRNRRIFVFCPAT